MWTLSEQITTAEQYEVVSGFIKRIAGCNREALLARLSAEEAIAKSSNDLVSIPYVVVSPATKRLTGLAAVTTYVASVRKWLTRLAASMTIEATLLQRIESQIVQIERSSQIATEKLYTSQLSAAAIQEHHVEAFIATVEIRTKNQLSYVAEVTRAAAAEGLAEICRISRIALNVLDILIIIRDSIEETMLSNRQLA